MPHTVDVAVVGDGVVGAAIAYQLAARGRSVALLSREGAYDTSATSGSAGQVRLHHSDPHDARLTALGLETFENWADVIGGDCGFRRTGFAFLVDEKYAPTLADSVAELTALGIGTSLLTPAELAAEQPALDLSEVAAVAYEPRGGYADPTRTRTALIDRARQLGATVLSGPEGAGLLRTGDRITGAAVGHDQVSAGQVVVAAGAWSAGICAAAGVRPAGYGAVAADGDRAPGQDAGPVVAREVGWAVADCSAVAGASSLCMVIDDIAGTYFRPDGRGRVLFRIPLDGRTAPPGSRRIPVDSDEVARARALAAPRLRGITTAPVVIATAASEAYAPDGRALVGPVPEHPGLYLATAFSGGGFKAAPAVGLAVAAELDDGVERPELAPYRPGRFATGLPAQVIKRYRHM